MEEKRRGRAGFIILIALLVIVILAIAAAGIYLLVPRGANKLQPDVTGIGFESLVGGEYGWMGGGMKANLLAVAISRGSVVDQNGYTEELATLHLLADGSPAEVTLLRDPESGKLAFRDQNGDIRTHVQRYLFWLLDDGALDPVFTKAKADPIAVEGNTVDAYAYDYLGKSLSGESRRFQYSAADNTADTVSLTKIVTMEPALTVEGLPAAARVTVTEQNEEQTVAFTGPWSSFSEFEPVSHTPYDFRIEVADDSGNAAEYRFAVEYQLDPVVTVEPTSMKTGGSFVIRIDGVKEGDTISCDMPFDFTAEFAVSGHTAFAVVPINYAFTPGEHNMTVHCADYSQSFTLSVTQEEYEEQHLTITGEGAAAGSADASREYAETMNPLFVTVDPNKYWEGLFIQPVDGTITTNFGIYRYTNGSTTASRHAGIDIANAEGTDIVAPNNGKVIYSGFLTMSGNTILIEHGMGLHTLYMHMQDRTVEAGDMVEQGQLIGHIGTTGYSTGPHLHYAMMIKDYSISPWYAQDGTAGFYALEQYLNSEE